MLAAMRGETKAEDEGKVHHDTQTRVSLPMLLKLHPHTRGKRNRTEKDDCQCVLMAALLFVVP